MSILIFVYWSEHSLITVKLSIRSKLSSSYPFNMRADIRIARVNPYAHKRPKLPKKPNPAAPISLLKPEHTKPQHVRHIGANVKKDINKIML